MFLPGLESNIKQILFLRILCFFSSGCWGAGGVGSNRSLESGAWLIITLVCPMTLAKPPYFSGLHDLICRMRGLSIKARRSFKMPVFQTEAQRGQGTYQRAYSYLMGRTSLGVLGPGKTLYLHRSLVFFEKEIWGHQRSLYNFQVFLLHG